MKKFISFIPNLLTLGNLFCGITAIWLTFYAYPDIHIPIYFIFAAALLDVFDGLTARLLHSESAIGGDLDSLSDIVSFAVAPTFLLLEALRTNLPDTVDYKWIALPLFVMPLFAAYRLAKFNRDTRSRRYFYGLPVPANALFWIGWSERLIQTESTSVPLILSITYSLVIVMGILMVSNLPLLSLKTHIPSRNRQEKGTNLSLLILGLIGLFIVALWKMVGFAHFIIVYIIVSPFIIKRIERYKV